MLTLCVLAMVQDATELRTALGKLQGSYAFKAETTVEGMKPDVEVATAEGLYQRRVGFLTLLPELSVVKNGKKVAFEKKGGSWTSFKKTPTAASRPDKVPDAPHEEIASLVSRAGTVTKTQVEGKTVLTLKAEPKRVPGWADGYLALEQVGATGEATLKLTLDDKGLPASYELTGSGKAPDGKEFKIVRKVQLTEVGTAKLELPEAARAALAAP